MMIHPKQENSPALSVEARSQHRPTCSPTKKWRWIMPLAQELSRQLAVTGLPVPRCRACRSVPLLALQHGRAAQREVGAQLFAAMPSGVSRASRRAVAVIRRIVRGALGGVSSGCRCRVVRHAQAEGFRCPLFPPDRARRRGDDAVSFCTTAGHDVRVVGGAPDKDPARLAAVQPTPCRAKRWCRIEGAQGRG
jgi:hypothetical protein